MIGSGGITESGNTTPMETRAPFATLVMDSEQSGAFQLTLEQVTLPLAPPVTAEAPTTPVAQETQEAQEAQETQETQEALESATKSPMEPRNKTEKKAETEKAVSAPDASLSALSPLLVIPVPAPVLKVETIQLMDVVETAETLGVSSLPRPLDSESPQEPLPLAAFVKPQPQELTDALTMLTPVVDTDTKENQEVSFAPEVVEQALDTNVPTAAPKLQTVPSEASLAQVTAPHTEPITAAAPSLLTQLPSTVSVQPSPLVFPEAPLGAVRLPELSQQLIPMLRRVNEEGNQEIRVRLDPPHLGELSVLIESGKEGLTVRVVAQTREALLLLQDQRSSLQEQLGRQNFSIASFTASLAGDSSGQRSLPHYYQTASHHSLRDSTPPGTEVSSVALRIPLHTGGLDAHA